MEDKLTLAKGITKFVVSSCVGGVVCRAVTANVPSATKIQQIEVAIGAYAVAGMISDKASDWAGQKFDHAIESLEKFKDTLKKEATK